MLFGAAFSAVLAGRMLNKRSIVKLGSSGVSGEVEVSRRTRRGQLRLALLRRWADKVVVLDEIMQAEAVSIGISPDNIKLISNGIDAQLFSVPTTVNKADIMPAEKVNVLFVGRLVDEKSLPTLLKAFQKSLRTCPYLHLTLVGDGPDRNMLEALVEYLQIKKRTTFAGKQRDVHAYLSHADIFVLPSKTEGMSNALLEAMAAGLPCLATPVGASPRMLDSGNSGILLPVGDVDAWAQALSDMGHDPERRASLGQTAKRRVMSEYDFSIIGARYEALYAELVKLNASAGQRM